MNPPADISIFRSYGLSNPVGSPMGLPFPEASARSNSENLDFTTLLRRLWHRKLPILLTTGLFSLAVAGVVSTLSPHYVAHALLLVGSGTQQGRPASGNSAAPIPDAGLVQTHVELLKSPALAAEIVRDLKLYDLPEFNPMIGDGSDSSGTFQSWLRTGLETLFDKRRGPTKSANREVDETVTAFLSRLTAEPKGTSRVIDVTFDSTDPTLSAAVANKVIQSYIAEQAALRSHSVTQTADWLHKKIIELQDRVHASEADVEKYRNDAGLYRTANGQPLISKELEEVRTQLSAAQMQRAALEDRLRIARASPGLDLTQDRGGVESPTAALGKVLDTQIANLQQQLAEASASLGPQHPKIVAMRSNLANLNRSKREQQQNALKSIEDQVKVATLTEEGLADRLRQLQQTATKLDGANVELKAREREAEADRLVLTNFIARYNEASLARDATIGDDIQIVSNARVPLTPERPKKVLLIVIAGCLSAFGSCAWALRPNSSRTFQSMEEVETLTSEKALGLVPTTRLARISPTWAPHQASSYSKALREIFANLIMSGSGGPRAILMTSSRPAEGKTTLALSLAALAGLNGHRTVLIDADFWKAGASNALGLHDAPGLGELLEEKAELSECLISQRSSGFDIIPPGHLSTESATTAIEYFSDLAITPLKRRGYDFIIIDAPPVFAAPETFILASHADATLVAVHWARTPRSLVQATLKRLRESGALIAGLALTMVDERRHALHGLQEGYAEAIYFAKETTAYYGRESVPEEYERNGSQMLIRDQRMGRSLVPFGDSLLRFLGQKPARNPYSVARLNFPRPREAVIVIGMHALSRNERPTHPHRSDELLARMSDVIEFARDRNLAIIHFEAEGDLHSHSIADTVITFGERTAFPDMELRERQVNHLFLIGFDSVMSIDDVARAALAKGYRVTFISDLIVPVTGAGWRQTLAGYEEKGAFSISSNKFMRLYTDENSGRRIRPRNTARPSVHAQIARAISFLAERHGLPNRFSVAEIAEEARISPLKAETWLERNLVWIERTTEPPLLLTRELEDDGFVYITARMGTS